MKRFVALLMTVMLLLSSACAESATAALQEMYAQAELLMVQGDYAGAAAKFEALGTYSDASQMTMYCKAIAAAEMLGLYSMAVDAFIDLGEFKDSKQMAKYYEGRAHEAAGTIDVTTASDSALDQALWQLEEAEKVYGGLAFFKDSLTRLAACGERIKEIKNEQNSRAQIKREQELARMEVVYQDALVLEQNGEYAEAIKLYQSIKGYKDSTERIQICQTAILDGKYDAAIALMNAGKYSEAIEAFKAIKTHRDSAAKIKECETAILDGKYDAAVALMNEGKYSEAIAAFEAIGNHKDSVEKITECKYGVAVALMEDGKYSEAYDVFIALDGYADSATKAESIYVKATKEKLSQVKVGSYITFGAYEQDNNIENGKENISWLVLAKENDRILVLSRYALDAMSYNNQYTDVTWETCTIREWLNTDFLNVAFNSTERTMIPVVTVPPDKNPSYSTDPGRATQDKVFLLSSVELHRYSAPVQCWGTSYAEVQEDIVTYTNDGQCQWWLRTPGSDQSSAVAINGTYGIFSYGLSVYYSSGHTSGVRPAMWIELDLDVDHNADFTPVVSEPTPAPTPVTKSVIITADSAKIRTEASISAGLVKTAYKGESFTLLSETGDFYKISVNGNTGYIHKGVCKIQ